jgi:hypothetical protein
MDPTTQDRREPFVQVHDPGKRGIEQLDLDLLALRGSNQTEPLVGRGRIERLSQGHHAGRQDEVIEMHVMHNGVSPG